MNMRERRVYLGLGTSDQELRERFREHKAALKAKVAAANDRIHQEG